MRIATWNIHDGRTSPADLRSFPKYIRREMVLQGIGELLTAQDIDIALLQEVDRGSRRSNWLDQLPIIRESSSFRYVKGITCAHLIIWGHLLEAQGNAILSQYPINGYEEEVDLPNGGEQRKLMQTYISTPEGEIVVFNTHLTSGDRWGRRMREAQFRALAERLRPYEGRPIILGGDFNADYDEIRDFLDAVPFMKDPLPPDKVSFKIMGVIARNYDHILVSQGMELIDGSAQIEKTDLSDHYLVSASFHVP